ncbi:hypothetical protein PTSG_06646 [Salpingoeca rosetta]|uniref:C-type lectin domain-containing protein n=1 Tax=Salpingoeca rosetta (strain ATCC 50818 / BSB-021) TaxID=946362 RepID=F2UFK9_SALR5|nr:uncharacterized protein PTSG_06646 [Salpingoeca rosetta]EGD75577.1 hypothetical protein PTSG_06646 [Salpingoeca rosetta]|eukprot:XP_004992034.1 hypothetical protein PTSG_06646 [Salpingoeca rosetta]
MPLLLRCAVVISALAAVACEASCPDSASPVAGGGSNTCKCQPGTSCTSDSNSAACTHDLDGFDTFASTQCSDCKCIPDALVHEVVTPTIGTTCYLGGPCPVTWIANVQVEAVDVHLLRVTTSGGTSRPKLERTIASSVANNGSFPWRVPSDLSPDTMYKVAVVATNNLVASAQTPTFTIAAVPTGSCPAGYVSTTGSYPGCAPCSQGTYASSDHMTCSACPSGTTTPSVGAAAATDCSLDNDSPLASFVKYPMHEIEEQDIHQLRGVTLERCARLCIVDVTCKSFDFTAAGTTGTCSLAADTRGTSLTHTFVPTDDATTAHYERTDKYGQLILAQTAFVESPDTHIQTTTAATTVSARVSVEACAVLCIHSATCKAFAAGNAARRGECFLYTVNSSDVSASQVIMHPAHQLDLYEQDLSSPACTAGTVSPSAREECTPCARGTFSTQFPRYSCNLCPSGTFTSTTGAATKDKCKPLTCPAASRGPDDKNDCVCLSGSTCEGDECKTDSSTGTTYFAATCTSCTCKEAKQPPSIDAVLSPAPNARLYYGTRANITWAASNGVSNVNIRLYQEYALFPGYLGLVATIVNPHPNTGVYTWTVPSNLAAASNYYVVIFHNAKDDDASAPTYRYTGPFFIGPAPTGPCPSGEHNPVTGENPCTLCPIGTYWVDAHTCSKCPNGTTTANNGAQSVADCSVSANDALAAFTKLSNMYIKESNQGGEFLEDADHMTVEECARRCLDDAGCKSFDAGAVSDFQEGDCFLSYDNPDTAAPSRVRSISQLDLYVRRDARPVLDRRFTKVANAYLRDHDDGGLFFQENSPEACAQLCLNDVCCKSFDAGQLGTTKEYDCYLSYDNRQSAPGAFVTDASQHLDYYEKKIDLQLRFDALYDDLITSDNYKRSFESQVALAITNLNSVDDDAAVAVSISSTSTAETDAGGKSGYITADVMFLDDAIKDATVKEIEDKTLQVQFPPLFGDVYTARFGKHDGPCADGTISASGDRVDECTTCRAGTYTNLAQTICLHCPDGTTSTPGSTNAKQCTPVDAGDASSGLFAVGDEWVGHFSASCKTSSGGTTPCTGRVSFEVVSASGSSVRLYATFTHGQYCNEAAGCREESAGVSEFYYTAHVSSNHFSATFVPGTGGWGGITDRTFVRENIDATLQHTDDQHIEMTGSYGDGGSVRLQKQCSAEYEPTTFNTGDAWLGTYHCTPRTVGDMKAAEGVEDVRRMELLIESVDPSTGAITAIVDFDHYAGIGQYKTTATFDSETTCFAVEFTPTKDAWITMHPLDVHAHQLTGKLSDSGELFSGQLNENPNCACNGQVSDELSQRGGSCDAWDGDGNKWCYVDATCPSATVDSDFPALHRAPCGLFPDCTDFYLTRICAVEQPACEHGFTRINNRCYKVATTASTAGSSPITTSFAGAVDACSTLSDELSQRGGSCDAWDGDGNKWCYVDATCPSATVDSDFPALHRAPCGLFPDCTDFYLTRICAVEQPACEHGFTRINNRCYKVATTASTAGNSPITTSFAGAVDACSVDNATVVSLHSLPETENVVQLLRDAGVTSAWIGLRTTENGDVAGGVDYMWVDGTPFGDVNSLGTFANWADGQPTAQGGKDGCAYLDLTKNAATASNSTGDDKRAAGLWYDDGVCTAQRAVVCKKLSPIVTPSCACTGQTNSDGDGGACGTWCYVSQYCPRAVEDQGNEGLFWAICPRHFQTSTTTAMPASSTAPPESTTGGTTTTAAPTCHEMDPSTYTRDDGTCAQCTTTDDCDTNQVLLGECGMFTTPVCVACDSTCAACSALGADKCTSCADGYVWSLDGKRCVSSCPLGQFADTSAGQCKMCHDTCATCDGTADNACLSCAPASNLFLQPNDNSGGGGGDMSPARGVCVAECNRGFFANQSRSEDEYETAAPTPTSNRVCRMLTPCKAGEYELKAPTTTTDRKCTQCAAGTTDLDPNSINACTTCDAGTYTPPGHVGPCPKCPAGTADDDSDPSTPCAACMLGQTYAAAEGSLSCSRVDMCAPGEEEALRPTTTRNRVCVACTMGTFNAIGGNGTRCVPWTTCGAGMQPSNDAPPSASQDRMCVPCATDEDTGAALAFKPTEGNFACSRVKLCAPGTQEMQRPTATSDRVCGRCPLGTFSPGINTACRKWKTCDADAFIAARGNATHDNTCQAATVCDAEMEWEQESLGQYADRVCAPLTQCKYDDATAPEFEQMPPTKVNGVYVSDRECAACRLSCPDNQTPTRECTRTSDTRCANCTECLPHQYVVMECTTEDDTKCGNCTVCGDGQYQKTPCSHTLDTVCDDIHDCPSGSYQVHPPTPVSDRVCAGLTTCGEYEVVAMEPTPTSDRVCESCDGTSEYFKEGECVAVTECPPGMITLADPTPSTDRTCTRCPNKHFKATAGQEECQPWTDCVVGEVVTTAPTATSDRVCQLCDPTYNQYSSNPTATQCENATVCEPGTYVDVPLTSTRDRKCKPCPSGTFSNEANMASCTPVQPCSVGSGLVTAATPSTDRVCAPCSPPHTFSSTPTLEACAPVSDCAPGYEEDTPPTLTTDRTCTPCEATVTFKAESGQAACQSVSACPAGQEEDIPPTTSSDRVCKPCGDGTFKAGEAGMCQPHRGVCQPGTHEVTSPTTSTDRSCESCLVENSEYQDEQDKSTCKVLTTCRPGSYVSVMPLPAQNRECTACPAGSYSDTENAAQCTPCGEGEYQDARSSVKCQPARVCGVGEFVSAPATSSSDTQCGRCDGTTEFQNEPDQTSCKPVRVCGSLEEQVVPPTAVSDRVCQCKLGVGYVDNGATACTPVSVCQSGHVEFLPATRTSDRVCVMRGSAGSLQVQFRADFSILQNAEEEATFLQLLFSALRNTTLSARGGVPAGSDDVYFKGVLSAGSILADVGVSNGSLVPMLQGAVESGHVAFWWRAKQQRFVAVLAGPCPPGYISPSGSRPNCTACPANTHANDAATVCTPCPDGWTSPEGSADANDCQPPVTVSPTPTTTPQGGTRSPEKSSNTAAGNTGLIVGIVVGALVLGACVVVAALILRRRRAHVLQPPRKSRDGQQSAFHNPLYEDPTSLTRGGDADTGYDNVPGFGEGDGGYDHVPDIGPALSNPTYDTALFASADPPYDTLDAALDEDDDMQHVHGYLDVVGLQDQPQHDDHDGDYKLDLNESDVDA